MYLWTHPFIKLLLNEKETVDLIFLASFLTNQIKSKVNEIVVQINVV